MGSVLFTSAGGWALVVLLSATIAPPYLIRSRIFAMEDESRVSWRTRLRPHYWLGYVGAGNCAGPRWVPMQAGWAMRSNATGLYLASGALLLLCVQIVLGLSLQQPRGKQRRAHFWMMVTVVALALGNIGLNSLSRCGRRFPAIRSGCARLSRFWPHWVQQEWYFLTIMGWADIGPFRT